jgi:hypothetical protein
VKEDEAMTRTRPRPIASALPFVLSLALATATAAQPKALESKPPELIPGDSKKAQGLMSAPTLTGKVTEVNAAAKTFTLTAGGKATTFSGSALPTLPKVGDQIEVTYNSTISGEMRATTVKSSKSNSSD